MSVFVLSKNDSCLNLKLSLYILLSLPSRGCTATSRYWRCNKTRNKWVTWWNVNNLIRLVTLLSKVGAYSFVIIVNALDGGCFLFKLRRRRKPKSNIPVVLRLLLLVYLLLTFISFFLFLVFLHIFSLCLLVSSFSLVFKIRWRIKQMNRC